MITQVGALKRLQILVCSGLRMPPEDINTVQLILRLNDRQEQSTYIQDKSSCNLKKSKLKRKCKHLCSYERIFFKRRVYIHIRIARKYLIPA